MTLVLWSGGCDSTLALLMALEKATMQDKVRTLSIKSSQLPSMRKEKMARDRMIKLFKRRGYNYDRHDEVTIDVPSPGFSAYNLGQPPLWISLACMCLEKDENLIIGYIQGDCVWAYINDVRKMFQNTQNINGKTGKLLLPLEEYDKAWVIQSLMGWEILDYCWYCENGNSFTKPCGTCNSCLRHNTGEIIRRVKYESDHDYTQSIEYLQTLSKRLKGHEKKKTKKRKVKKVVK